MVFVFLCLTSFIMIISKSIQCSCKWHYFIHFNAWVIFHCIYVPQLPYPFNCLWTFRLFPCLGCCKWCWYEHRGACAAAQSRQSCPTVCDPIDGSPPGSPVPGILQARTLEWVAISFSNAWKWKVKVKSLSRIRLLATPWTAAYQAPLSMGFSRKEYWSGVPLPSPACNTRWPLKNLLK